MRNPKYIKTVGGAICFQALTKDKEFGKLVELKTIVEIQREESKEVAH